MLTTCHLDVVLVHFCFLGLPFSFISSSGVILLHYISFSKETPLQYAAKAGNMEALKILIEEGKIFELYKQLNL
jgi:hypothetical protein